ncbi:uncharacterized protein [Eurosta solidaginis]|uniref:uncharacterized protein n=1 Tax=Eurosta solidaginis TaxID=178769 RepID=UPI0035306ED7
MVITCDPLSPPVQFDEPIIETPSPSCHPFSPPGEVHDSIVGTPTTSRCRNKSSSTSEEMFSKMMESIQQRNKAEQLFRQESLNCMTEFCAAMNNMANAVLPLRDPKSTTRDEVKWIDDNQTGTKIPTVRTNTYKIENYVLRKILCVQCRK